jgi:predicted phosphodiesterase
MLISILGDVHGNIDLAYKSIIDWQRKNKKKIDLILQVGDLGIYNPEKIPEVKKKILGKNPGELKIYEFIKNEKIYSCFFDKKKDKYSFIESILIFTRGNHDDGNYLKKIEEQNPDENIHRLNKHIFYLSDSRPTTFFSDNGEYITIAGIGGIDKNSRPKSFKKDPAIKIDEENMINALNLKDRIEIFLTHMHPEEAGNNGSLEISELIKTISPKFYFFGHQNNNPTEFKINQTQCYGLKRIEYNNIKNITDKSIIILEKKDGILRII